jgi:hypothetical protein
MSFSPMPKELTRSLPSPFEESETSSEGSQPNESSLYSDEGVGNALRSELNAAAALEDEDSGKDDVEDINQSSSRLSCEQLLVLGEVGTHQSISLISDKHVHVHVATLYRPTSGLCMGIAIHRSTKSARVH